MKTEKSTTQTKSGVITKTVTVTETRKQEGNWKLSENAKGHMVGKYFVWKYKSI